MNTTCSKAGTSGAADVGVKVVVDVAIEVAVGGWNGVAVPVGWFVTGIGVDVGGIQETSIEARRIIRSERFIGSPNSSKSFLVGVNPY